MVIYLYGPDSYRRNAKVRELLREYGVKHAGKDTGVFDLEEEPKAWLRVKDRLQQPSMFTGTRALVVLGGGGLSERDLGAAELKAWAHTLKEEAGAAHSFLIINDEEAPLKQFSFLLEKPVRAQEFALLEGAKLKKFFDDEAARQGLSFQPDAEKHLLLHAAASKDRSWRVVTELAKLACAGLPQPAGLRDVARVTGWQKTDETFPLALGFLKAPFGARRLGYLEQLALKGDEARYTFNLLCSLARNREDIEALSRADVMVKSGAYDDEAALLACALGI